MEVILKKDMQPLGFSGDIVNVKPGFGRNFLIPKGIAELAAFISANAKILLDKSGLIFENANHYH